MYELTTLNGYFCYVNVTAIKINLIKFFKFRYLVQYLIYLLLKELAFVPRGHEAWQSGGWSLPQKQVSFPFKPDDAINPAQRKMPRDFADTQYTRTKQR